MIRPNETGDGRDDRIIGSDTDTAARTQKNITNAIVALAIIIQEGHAHNKALYVRLK